MIKRSFGVAWSNFALLRSMGKGCRCSYEHARPVNFRIDGINSLAFNLSPAMSHQTRRSFMRKSAVTSVGIGTLATGSAIAEDAESSAAGKEIATKLAPDSIGLDGEDEVVPQVEWPVDTSFDSLAPGEVRVVNSPAIVDGVYYDFDVSYSPEINVGLGFLDWDTSKFHGEVRNGSGNYSIQADAGIPEDSAFVGAFNLPDNRRDITGDLEVDK